VSGAIGDFAAIIDEASIIGSDFAGPMPASAADYFGIAGSCGVPLTGYASVAQGYGMIPSYFKPKEAGPIAFFRVLINTPLKVEHSKADGAQYSNSGSASL
jgi:hypothetical protein